MLSVLRQLLKTFRLERSAEGDRYYVPEHVVYELQAFVDHSTLKPICVKIRWLERAADMQIRLYRFSLEAEKEAFLLGIKESGEKFEEVS